MGKKTGKETKTTPHDEGLADLYQRLEREMLDSFDEELEMELDDQRFQDESDNGESTKERQQNYQKHRYSFLLWQLLQ